MPHSMADSNTVSVIQHAQLSPSLPLLPLSHMKKSHLNRLRLGKLVFKALFCSWFPVVTSARQFGILFFF